MAVESSPKTVDEPTEDLAARVERLKKYIRDHPGVRLMDLEVLAAPELQKMYLLAVRMVKDGRLFEHPSTKALSYPGQLPLAKVKNESQSQGKISRNEVVQGVKVHVLQDLRPFIDDDGKEHHLKIGDLVELPAGYARAIIKSGKAEEVLEVEDKTTSPPAATPEAPAPNVKETVPSIIPEQFNDPNDRFILLGGRSKIPLGGTDGHNTPGSPYNYSRDDKKLLAHITAGGNYGPLCGAAFGRLVGIDGDRREVREAVEGQLPETLTDKTGREDGEGRHYLFRIKDPESLKKTIPLFRYKNGKKVLGDDGRPLNYGHIKYAGGYLVGPGSLHPDSGKRYEVINDAEIAEITTAQLLEALDEFLEPPPEDTGEDLKEMTAGQPLGDWSWLDALRIEDVMDLSGFRGSRSGWLHGVNPWHGTTNRYNLKVNLAENRAWCWREEVNISPLKALALNEGIIKDCDDKLRKADFWRAVDIAVEKYGLVRPTPPETEARGPDGHPLWRFTVEPSKKLPLDQLWRWPECFALIGLKCSVPLETCEGELLAALERSGAEADQVKKALEVVHKLYAKYGLGEDRLDKKARDNIKGCGLKVSEDFLQGLPRSSKETNASAPEASLGRLGGGLNGYDVDLAEPYYEDDGSPAAAMVWNRSRLDLKTLEDWKKENPALGEYLEEKFFVSEKNIWYYPSRPVVPEDEEDLRELHNDIMECVDHYVEHPEPVLRPVFATWLMGSYLIEFAVRSPLWSLYGVSGAGKGQVEDMIRALAYRGIKLINPTPAVLFRWSDEYHLTFALDELNDKDRESFTDIMNFIKGAFDGTPVPRVNTNTGKVELFQTRVFVAPSFKDKHPREDVKNRGFSVTMHRNSAPKDLVPKEDIPQFQKLRSRLMGLRLRALSDPEFISRYLAMMEKQGTPEALGFDRRPKDIAVSLLLPAIMSGQRNSLVKAIKISAAEARFDNNLTFTAMVQHTLEEERDSREKRVKEGLTVPSSIYNVIEIKSRLEREMKDNGDLKEGDKLETRRVTDAFKTLGYLLGRKGAGKNQPTINLEEEQNVKAFARNRELYGPDKDESEGSEAD